MTGSRTRLLAAVSLVRPKEHLSKRLPTVVPPGLLSANTAARTCCAVNLGAPLPGQEAPLAPAERTAGGPGEVPLGSEGAHGRGHTAGGWWPAAGCPAAGGCRQASWPRMQPQLLCKLTGNEDGGHACAYELVGGAHNRRLQQVTTRGRLHREARRRRHRPAAAGHNAGRAKSGAACGAPRCCCWRRCHCGVGAPRASDGQLLARPHVRNLLLRGLQGHLLAVGGVHHHHPAGLRGWEGAQ